jgi:hypothetical protein
MSQYAASSSQMVSSQLLDRGDRDYTMPAGFATAAVQAAIAVVKQFRKGEISKTEAILEIQAALAFGEDEPSNEELVSALSSYISILDDIQQSSGENQPRGAASSTRVPRAPKSKAPIRTTSSSPTSSSNREQTDHDVEFIPAPGNSAGSRREHSVNSQLVLVLSILIAHYADFVSQPHCGVFCCYVSLLLTRP